MGNKNEVILYESEETSHRCADYLIAAERETEEQKLKKNPE
jgi:hypothetical protein